MTKLCFSAIMLGLNLFSACANMAQVVEQLTRNEQVEGSSPSIGSHDGWMNIRPFLWSDIADQILEV